MTEGVALRTGECLGRSAEPRAQHGEPGRAETSDIRSLWHDRRPSDIEREGLPSATE
jgi:hypothetical protein